MDLGEFYLNEIERECNKKGKGYVPRRQIKLLQEAILRTKAIPQLGIIKENQKGNKRKLPKEREIRGRRPTNKG